MRKGGEENGILDIYDGNESVDTDYDDWIWENVYEKRSESNQRDFWISNDKLHEEHGYMAVCTQIFRQEMV